MTTRDDRASRDPTRGERALAPAMMLGSAAGGVLGTWAGAALGTDFAVTAGALGAMLSGAAAGAGAIVSAGVLARLGRVRTPDATPAVASRPEPTEAPFAEALACPAES